MPLLNGYSGTVQKGGSRMKAFEYVDFYETAAAFDEDEKQIRDSVRAFVNTECMPIIADCFDRGEFPMDLIPRMSEMGLFGVHVEGYGCKKRSHLAYGLICQELGRCDSGLRAMFSVQNSLVMFPIYEFGSDSQRGTWLPKLANAEAIGCFGLSEPEYGSNPAGMITTARKTNGHYVLNG
jgi:glutaryl-CoA dehydrogenase